MLIMIRKSCFTICSLLLMLFLVGCDEVSLLSQWRTSLSKGDTSVTKWPETSNYFAKDSKVMISVLNDADYLYIRLATRSKATKKMLLHGGLTTWLDVDGGTDKTFGVLFPISQDEQWMGPKTDHRPRNGLAEMLEDSQLNMALIDGSDGMRETMPTTKGAERGIDVWLGLKQEYLFCELKIPYTVSGGNKVVGLGFETVAPKRPSAGGSGGRGGGRKPPEGKGARPEALKVWFEVQLADSPKL